MAPVKGTFLPDGKLWMGPGTLEVPTALFALNRKRLVEKLQGVKKDAIVLLQGGSELPFYDTDVTYVFRQESYFIWCFGTTEAGCYGAIDVSTGDSYLFVPRFPAEYAVWMGPLVSLTAFKNKYDVTHVYYVDQLDEILQKINRGSLLTLKGPNTDSGLVAKEATFAEISKYTVDNEVLFPIIADLRVYKTPFEIEVMKYVVEISSAAHMHIMRTAKADMYEYQCESEFLNYCYRKGGCRHASYTCICGSGTNGAILHYGHAGAPNNYPVKDGTLCLFDMGANYFGYAADITVTFPVSGKFTPDQKLIYEAVLASNLAVFKAGKPGVSWSDMHVLANRVLLEELKKGGILKGSVDEMLDADIAAIFQPHGLGHLLGLDVHDVGGYLKGHPERSSRPGLKSLRTARLLEENMCFTIEPGCYFIDPLLDQALANPKQSKFLVPEVLQRFRGFGGVRIEDDVLVTKDGIVNLTKVPRTVQEIEDWISGKNDILEKLNIKV
ncbi:xaa-Pro dipeptidase isoform X1 [Anoplophora glabripennis]|uniref:xaa-Pro dipeptidase isoform X1 n=1 Tax=Anoplophora glabripennis TaxID=217634 RepID=UPI000873D228|nr:xaa-Pro dipeptidase isoform X1 [Anoplophora glabripennis]